MKTLLLGTALLISSFSFGQASFKFSDKTFPSGSVMTRRNIGFSDDCHRAVKPSKTLDSLYNFLKNHPTVKMEIGAHIGKPCATCKGCSQSDEGSKAIRAWLVKKGIDGGRLFAKGYGQTAPLNTDGGVKAVKINERLTFKII